MIFLSCFSDNRAEEEEEERLADLQKSANQQVADMMGQALANVHLFGDDDEDGRGESERARMSERRSKMFRLRRMVVSGICFFFCLCVCWVFNL
jgi:hypothetical protein